MKGGKALYSRTFGIESDGVYSEPERRYEEPAPLPDTAAMAQPKKGLDIKGRLKNIDTEDLLLLAIGALLLLDGTPDNDMLILLIAFLLFF